MRLVLVGFDQAVGSVRLLSEATFADRSAALAELERIVAGQDGDGVEHLVVDLETATPVILLPARAPVVPADEPAAERAEELAEEAGPAQPEEPSDATVPPEPDGESGRPVAQAGPAITPPSEDELTASILAAATALEGSEEDTAEPVAPLEALESDFITATDEAGAAADTPSADEVTAAPPSEQEDAPIQWPWDKPSDEEPVQPVRESLGAVEPAPAAPPATATEGTGYEPESLNMQQYTCNDCVYVNTCPNRDQKAPYDCGSFQWKSG
jgi:hypothetical protein